MGRLVLVALAISIPAAAGWAQTASPAPSPWQTNVEPQTVRALDLSLAQSNQLSPVDPDSRIVAGTEVLPDGMFGLGMFGDKAEGTAHARATARDFTLPPARKPAVGFSLKF